MKKHIIVNAFITFGMWLLSAKARIKKMRLYKKKRLIDKVKQDDTFKLPPLLLTWLDEIWNIAAKVQAFDDCDLITYSDNII